MESAYEPKKYEAEIYQRWEASGFFNPDKLLGKRSKKYSIVIPPPNITGELHLGHALENTIFDIIIRQKRMNGYKTLWLPGTDHAGIATQNVVEKELAKENIGRYQLGREKFVERVWQWKEKYGNLIIEQLKKLGCSCDWLRLRFTLDDDYARAVQTAFIHYYQKGYIYRGQRIVNWCPRCATAISDIEIKYQEEKSKLWYIKYPLETQIGADRDADQRRYPRESVFDPRESAYILVATTRPETMLGDSAVAVSPKDERYKNLVGQNVILPIVNRPIPIVAHRLVDLEFGTGALKITPAHDAVDWQIGQENKLAVINVIGPDGRMTKEAGQYAGSSVKEARARIIEELQKQNLLVKEEDYQHQISLCDRCGTAIEPQMSLQWFVKMEHLAKPAYDAVAKNKINIIPERYQKVYLDWLKNIKDWCISRQLWWGHRLPVWFCVNQTGISNDKFLISKQKIENCKLEIENSSADEHFIVSAERPKQCPFCKSCKMEQSADVLDTWFSSALWPFATLGWPNKTKDLADYYPTSLLSTARDILYLWVARMVFSGLEFVKKIPFKNVYIHSTILNPEGKRMSKSLGTGVDPLGLIEQYGADATRLGLIMQINRDQQAIKFDERSILSARNFINKLWNVSRFISLQYEKITDLKKNSSIRPITLSDKWILSSFNRLIDDTNKKIKNYEFGEAAAALYGFTWHELADWYLEIAKRQMNDEKLKQNTAQILKFIIQSLLKLWHPFIPFVTEEIYQQIGFGRGEVAGMLIVTAWPMADKKAINNKAEKIFNESKDWIILARRCRSEAKINPKEAISLDKLFALFKAGDQAIYGGLEKEYKKYNSERQEITCYLTKID